VTEQNNPAFGQAPQQPQQPPAAPLIPQQAFGDAPAPPAATGEGTFGAAPGAPPVPGEETFGAAPGTAPATGEGTFGAAPGTPLPPGEAFGAAPAPEKKRVNLKIVGVVGAVIVALLIAGIVVLAKNALSGTDTKQAQVGTCIGNLPDVAAGENKAANNAKVLDCTDANAAYKVEGRLENKTQAEAKADDACMAYANAEYTYSAIAPGGKGYVLCLSKIKR
jgi:hypothetical protein